MPFLEYSLVDGAKGGFVKQKVADAACKIAICYHISCRQP